MAPPVITLTTDFGASDGYVGAMKGVILGISPEAALVDISHHVPPQDIAHGAFVLGSAYRYFGSDTVHLAVVDPGVGTARRALLVVTPGGRFVAPDNGLVTHVMRDLRRPGFSDEGVPASKDEFLKPKSMAVPDGCRAYVLTNADYWRHPVSETFHGRDVFAPVAAHLSRGVSPEELGSAVDEVVFLNIGPPARRDGVLEGRIVFVDGFGNLVSNIATAQMPEGNASVEIGGVRIGGLSRNYAEGEGLLALSGSHGYLEIAVARGSAAARLGVGVGSGVRVERGG